MSTNIIRSIETTIQGEEIGSLFVVWDMIVETDLAPGFHPDGPEMAEQIRDVDKIRSIEFIVFDKVGIDVTEQILADKRLREITEVSVLSAVSDQSLEEIKS